MSDRTLAVLAFAIGEWSTALAHIDATAVVQPVDTDVRGAITNELNYLCRRWEEATRPPLNEAAIIAEARAWATSHQSEIDALTEEKKGSEHDPTHTAGSG